MLSFGSVALAQTQASLESPTADSFQQSGVSLIRGWVCQASKVEISIDGGPLQTAAYGTERLDTQAVCGDSNNGFGLTINWGNVGEGAHNLRAVADGVEFANVNFVITTLGGSFLEKLIGEYTLKDFPTPGSSPTVAWSEPHQNFLFTKKLTVPAVSDAPSSPRAFLESPTQGSSESGVSLIRGWVCEASKVEISIDGGARLATAYGTTRTDTQATCGDANNGFGLTTNWNRLNDGVHNLRAFADDVEFANVNFAVATLGSEFLTGLSSKQTLAEFPSAGKTTTVSWSEAHQNFVVARTTATEPKIGILSSITDSLNRFATTAVGPESPDMVGVAATKDSAGAATKVNSLAWTDATDKLQADVALTTDGLPAAYKDSAGVEARFSNLTATTTTVSFFDHTGAPQGEPVTVPINVGFLQSLQTVANRIASNAQSAAVVDDGHKQLGSAAGVQTQAANSTLRFTPKALLINLQWYGGLTTGEVLCAVQAASAKAGILSQIATKGCQSPVISGFLTRASATRQAQADTFTDLVDPAAQQALRFGADVAESACATTATSADCLVPVAMIIWEREKTGTPITPSATQIPAPPGGMSASDGEFTDRVRITWIASPGATSYQVYRDGLFLGSTTATSFEDNTINRAIAPAARLSVMSECCTDSSTSGGVSYTYSVVACNSIGCSSASVATGSVKVTVAVPSVIGQTESEATSTLTAARLTLGTVTTQPSTAPAGTVISQAPAAGSAIVPGAAVNLILSTGPTTVPDVVGQLQSAATSAITAAKLTVGTVTVQDNTSPAGTVLSQLPPSGTVVAPGTTISLVVSSGPIAIVYVGSSEICYTVTAGFGANGVCSQCASSAASATLRNLGALTIDSPRFTVQASFDAQGNCTVGNLTGGTGTNPTTVSNRSFSYAYEVRVGGIGAMVDMAEPVSLDRLDISGGVGPAQATVNMTGTLGDSDMTASGSVSFPGQTDFGPVTIGYKEDIKLQISSRAAAQ
ncbi:MAG: PASTA domain-containing protein [Synechococcaceae cyanobacterium SM1_2_3]|nr:PASTA domain-containing protein [Synechococcaceae cyanobacterium SM1_2_3]